MAPIIGIDFGTTFSAVSHVNADGKIEILTESASARGGIIPSVVAFLENDRIEIGWKALAHRNQYPESIITSIKKWLGKTAAEISHAENILPYGFRGDASGKMGIECHGNMIPPEVIASYILAELKSIAEGALNTGIENVVLTIPVGFSEKSVDALYQSAKLAGFRQIHPIANPLAVFLSYVHQKKQQGLFVICDFGGGGVDLAIIEWNQKGVHIHAMAGSSEISGENMDQRMLKKIIHEISASKKGAFQLDPALVVKLSEEAEKAKHAVSHRGSYDIRLNLPDKDLKWTHALSRFELAELSDELLKKLTELCEHLLKTSGIDAAQIDEVIVSGGSSRMPFIQDALKQVFQKKVNVDMHPDLAAAYGAGLEAARLEGKIDLDYLNRVES